MSDPIDPLLMRLPEPPPPPALAATVMARIARESTPAPATADRHVRAGARSRGEIFGALWALIGAMLVVGVIAHRWMGIGSPPDVTSSRIGNGRLVLMPVLGSTTLLLCAGLVLYLVGLFAPLRRPQREDLAGDS